MGLKYGHITHPIMIISPHIHFGTSKPLSSTSQLVSESGNLPGLKAEIDAQLISSIAIVLLFLLP